MRGLKRIFNPGTELIGLAGPLPLAGALILWLAVVAAWAGADAFIWTAQNLLSIGWTVLVAAAVWLLPGLALLRLLWRGRRLSALERAPLALAAGVALCPLLLEIAHLVHLPANGWTIGIYVLTAAVVIFFPGRSASWRRAGKIDRRRIAAVAWPAFWLAGITTLTLVQRLYIVRDLPVGMWGDSVQHTMMAQLIVDNGGLFTSWSPYAALATFTYHFGFHANSAFFHWLSGQPVTQSVVLTGQLLNVMTVPLAYLLTVWLGRNRAAGLWAALMTSFINVQPAYYFNWGRYTQLAGIVVLPAVLIAWIHALAQPRWRWRDILLAAIFTSALALTHYIVTIFAALFLAVYIAAQVLRPARSASRRQVLLTCAAVGMLSLVLAGPWLANTLGGFLVRNTTDFVNGAVSADRIATITVLPPLTDLYVKPYLVVLAALGWVIAIVRRRWLLALVPAWILLLVLTIVPNRVGLPGAGVIDYFTVYIMLYLPIVPLAAYALGAAQAAAHRQGPWIISALAGASLIALTAWGFAWQQAHLLAADSQIFTPADARAVAWIRASTNPTDRFFVNSFPAFGGTLIAGSDGGWWLPLLAGRQTNLPPLTYGSERGQVAGYSKQINAFAAAMRGRPLTDAARVNIDLTSPSNYALLIEQGYRYVYNGAHPRPGPESVDHIDTAAMRQRPDLFRLVYDQDEVLIFQVEAAP